MPKARNQQISLSATAYYHCISRCVRRAFLCGNDSVSGKNYEHRKQWITQRLAQLGDIFAIDVCAFSVMSNHCHTVLHINTEIAQSWTEQDIIQRWQRLFSLPVLVERYTSGECHTQAERDKALETIEIWRERLSNISWFMRCLNEYVARKANAEDKCTGRFWEGRFKTQALLNEQALLACMVYVDLNPIRADICDTLEKSEHTSIKQRIEQVSNKKPETIVPLLPFISGSQSKSGIPFLLNDYFELTEWTGRTVREDKRGFIRSETPKILHKLGLDKQTWNKTVQGFSSQFYSVIGPEDQIISICQKQGKKWLRGMIICRQLFKNTTAPYPA